MKTNELKKNKNSWPEYTHNEHIYKRSETIKRTGAQGKTNSVVFPASAFVCASRCVRQF